MRLYRSRLAALYCCLALVACGGSNSSGTPPTGNGTVRVRFVDGAPQLEALINGVPQSLCLGPSAPCYLRVNGETVSQLFYYGTFTSFTFVTPGVQSLDALDTSGYQVGPLKSAPLSAGKAYTLIVVGSYPNYSVLTFEEPPSASTAQLSLYEASPSVPSADFGSFVASSKNGFKHLGSAKLGSVATVTLAKSVANVGGYVGEGVKPFTGGTITPSRIDSFDKHNALPFHSASRLSLFLFDANNSLGPLYGSLDR